MKIVVLVHPAPVAARGTSASRYGLDDLDAYPLEQAVRIARRRIDVQVTALTIGPRRALAAVRGALAAGADDGVHVLDESLDGCDDVTASRVAAAAIRRIGFHLVLCSCAARDRARSLLPVMLAERLDVPAVRWADAVWAGGGAVLVRRETGTVLAGSVEQVSVAFPALVSVSDRAGDPRLPCFAEVAQARHQPVCTWSLRDLGIEACGYPAPARAVAAHRDRAPAGRDRPGAAGSRSVLAGEPGDTAARLADFFTECHLP